MEEDRGCSHSPWEISEPCPDVTSLAPRSHKAGFWVTPEEITHLGSAGGAAHHGQHAPELSGTLMGMTASLWKGHLPHLGRSTLNCLLFTKTLLYPDETLMAGGPLPSHSHNAQLGPRKNIFSMRCSVLSCFWALVTADKLSINKTQLTSIDGCLSSFKSSVLLADCIYRSGMKAQIP